jgi:hypothetical protein
MIMEVTTMSAGMIVAIGIYRLAIFIFADMMDIIPECLLTRLMSQGRERLRRANDAAICLWNANSRIVIVNPCNSRSHAGC